MNRWLQLALVTALAAAGLGATGAFIVAQDEAIPVVATEFAFDPSAFTVEAGAPVSVTLANAGQAPHDITFELDAGRVVGSSVIRGGEETAVGFDAPAVAGAYTFYCSVGNHRERGMVGTLTVEGPPEAVAVVATEFAFDPNAFTVEAGKPVSVTLTNAGQAPHDITFELDAGRVVGSEVIRNGEVTAVGFDAPAVAGAYTFYCSVGNHKERGMVGTLTVEEPPEQFEAVATGLLSPRGLFVDGDDLYIGEGGTGTAGDGFVAGNLDGQVTKLSLSDPTDRTVIVSGLANAVDPGGGVIGANHAMPVTGIPVTLVALSGGPGHPDPKAQILAVDATGSSTVVLDMWAFEEANNPDGEEIDSNPWRLAMGPDMDGYVSDAGANTVLRVDNTDCTANCASVFAVFPSVGEDQDGAPISAVPTGLAWSPEGDALYVSLLASFAPAEAQVRRLEDTNGDGDAMDEGENTIALDGLTMAVDLAFDPSGRLWVIEFGGFAAQGRLVEVLKTGTGLAVDGIAAPSGLAFTADGDALIAAGVPGSGFVTSQVIRIPAERMSGAPTPMPTETTPTPTDEPGSDGRVYLPWADRP